VEASAVEIRVLGCLIEKQRTTPEVYPLSLNALRAACNQSTNREPVLSLDEPAIRQALEQLGRKRWVRLASGPGSRTTKYRHLLDDALGLSPASLALLAVLMLRGPQTPGELKGRSERLYPFGSLAEIEQGLERLVAPGLVVRLERRPGQKEERYAQRLGGAGESEVSAPMHVADRGDAPAAASGDRFDHLEQRVARLEEELDSLRHALASPPG